jgi:hypothetical protein
LPNSTYNTNGPKKQQQYFTVSLGKVKKLSIHLSFDINVINGDDFTVTLGKEKRIVFILFIIYCEYASVTYPGNRGC